MNSKRYLFTFLFTLLIVSYCESQFIPYRKEILPKIRAKIHSLYPRATNIRPGENSHIQDSTQVVTFKCNCPEDSNRFFITFDTNGNLLNEDIYLPIKYLPDTIASHIKRDTAKHYRYSDIIIKSLNNRGEVFYSISKWKIIDGPMAGNWIYILKFKDTGEYISTRKRWQNI